MAVLLLAEVNGTELAADSTAKAVRAATALGDVTILCASAGCGAAARRDRQIVAPQRAVLEDSRHQQRQKRSDNRHLDHGETAIISGPLPGTAAVIVRGSGDHS